MKEEARRVCLGVCGCVPLLHAGACKPMKTRTKALLVWWVAAWWEEGEVRG